MKTSASGFFVAALLTASALTTSHAQITPLLSYQGRVKVSGTDFSGDGQFKFALVRMDAVSGRQATAVADSVFQPQGFLLHIAVTDQGSGYTTPPAVNISDTTGAGAVAVAQVSSGGSVTNIMVQNTGSGYSDNPTVTIAAPTSGQVASTLWSNDGTSTTGNEPTGGITIPVSGGVFTIHLGDPTVATMAALPVAIFTNQPMYLRVWFNDGANGFEQLSPDTLLPTAGFSMVAATLANGVPDSVPPDGSITEAKLADAAVSSLKLADGAVSQAKLANAAVGTLQLADNAVSSAKVADGSIASAKLAGSSVSSSKLANGAVTETKIADTAVSTLKLADGSVNAAKLANGTVVRSVNGFTDQITLAAGTGVSLSQNAGTVTISAVNSGGGWNLNGNSGTSPTTDFLGTTDNQPLEIHAGGERVLRLEPSAQTGVANLLGGSSANTISGAVGGIVAGGGSPAAPNAIAADFSTISGGQGNEVNSASAVVSGGAHNTIGTSSDFSVIGGGNSNTVSQSAAYSSILGGLNNTISGGSSGAAVFGGTDNLIGSNAQYALSLGGFNNVVGNNALYAAVLGGSNNRALSPNSLAAGRNAQAQNVGSFVWADSNDGTFSSTAANQFSVRATGGVRIVTAIDGAGAPTAGVSLAAGDTSWSVISDRAVKKNIKPIDSRAILEKLSTVPVLQWNYRWETNHTTPHIGPMAQDFKAAFYPGRDDHTISTLEFDGVALAAIQGLNHKLEDELAEKDHRLSQLEAANIALQRRLEAIEQRERTLTKVSKE